jgi:cardiolipin synthase
MNWIVRIGQPVRFLKRAWNFKENSVRVSHKTPQLRASDLLNWPGFLTGIRLGIALSFPFLVHRPGVAVWAYAVALLTDVLDGALARHLGQESQAGAFADGWVDKILHVNAAWALCLHDQMPPVFLLLLFTRELIQLVQIPWLVGPFRRSEVCPQLAGPLGRATSIFQAITFFAAFAGQLPLAWFAATLTALTGIGAGVGYFLRPGAHGFGQVQQPDNESERLTAMQYGYAGNQQHTE